MKKFNAIFVSLSLVLTSSAVFAQPLYYGANYLSRITEKTIRVEPVETKKLAYEIALSELNALEISTASGLNSALNITNFSIGSNKTHLEDGSYVTVQERITSEGEMEYVGLVNVKVHYIRRDSNN
ncbi:DUF3316 domain-containing protein [Vibrio sp. F74]|uniref:DUF3316 domain-containing protein n=1 Tax=Vibrio sp. F74 TaxID=700020 RepID=UPI0035F5769D